MSDLNLRDIDPELIKELKRAAFEAGWTLKELCVHRLSGVTYGEIKRKAGPDPLRQSEAVEKASTSKMIIEADEELKPCDRCGGETVAWGPKQRRCPKCGQNYQR